MGSAVVRCSVCGASNGEVAVSRGEAVCRPCLGALGALVSGFDADRVSAVWPRRGSVARAPAPAASALEVEGVLTEFKKGVEQAISPDDAQTRLDVAIAYDEMGLIIDAVREAAHAFNERAPDNVARHAVEWLFAPHRCAAGALPRLLASLQRRGRG